jgi:hypothetical protein
MNPSHSDGCEKIFREKSIIYLKYLQPPEENKEE